MGLFRLLSIVFGGDTRRRRSYQDASPRPTPLRPLASAHPQGSTSHIPPPVRVPPSPPVEPSRRILKGRAWVVDGDTIVIDGQNIRLAGIDAPELDHPWGQKAKWAMVQLCRNRTITVELTDELSHGRLVGTCRRDDGRDLAEELVKQGLALDWKKYSGGRYRAFETADARKRLWRADARQKGRMTVDSGR